LKGADYVIASFAIGGNAYCGPVYALDVTIPMKYGVKQAVADTIGPGGIFRALRTAPVMMSTLDDMKRLCPNALLLNYVNPMAILTWVAYEYCNIPFIGLCHSVQGTSRSLAHLLGAPYDEVSYKVAGINHMAWFVEFKWQGQDMLAAIREKVKDTPDVRCDMCTHFGHFVTESPQHMSEYVPYYRKSDDLLERFELSKNEGHSLHFPTKGGRTYDYLMSKKRYSDAEGRPEKIQRQIAGEEPIALEKSYEYASEIMIAQETGKPFTFNGNVKNRGCIANLPYDCCAEVPCTVDKTGIHPQYFGKLPSHLAGLCLTNISVQRLTVEAIIEKNLEKAFHAMLLDPLTSAVCGTAEIKKMFDEMVEAEKEYLTCYM